MTPSWKSFLIRTGSALVAIALILGLYLIWGHLGLKVATVGAVIIGTWELTRLLFHQEKSLLIKILFYLLSLVVFATSAATLMAGALVFALSLILLIVTIFLLKHHDGNLEHMLAIHAKAALGFFYMGLLPSFAYKILDQTEGRLWFTFLLLTVLVGDTTAYIFGVLLGKNKVMPSVSPKKTWEGSIGGIIGSSTAGAICWYFFFNDHPVILFTLMGAIAGFFGQFGDFFESLLKRVADVKDSGKIMPGHGGILDRIDGILFAGPVILSGVLILSHFIS